MIANEWDARAMVDVAVMIHRYLAENPPPEGSRYGADFRDWAERLEAAGSDDLSMMNARRLREAVTA